METIIHTACPLCGTDKPNQNKKFLFDPYQVVQCTNCKLWYLSPRLSESEILKAYANPDYFKGGGEFGYSQKQGAYFDQENALRLTFRKFLRQLKRRNMTGGHLLEVGCSYGFLLEEAESMFKSLTGTDFDSEALKRVKQLGYQGIQGGVDALPTDKRYDLIVATGVIEHIYNPIEFVKQLSQYLSATGWIVLATPPMNSFWLKLQGKNWASFKIPEHVTYYDHHTLSELFRRCGATETTRLAYPQAYPLGMIGEKLGFSIPAWLAKYNIWLPATMFAIAARFDKTHIDHILSQFPKKRSPLPASFKKIYHEHYQNNRHGNTKASSLATKFEKWMHKKVAADLKLINYDYETLELGAGTLNHLAFENIKYPYDIVEPFTELYINFKDIHLIRNQFNDINEIDLQSNYDRILSIATFEHLCDLPSIIAKIGMLLKPDGVLRVAIPSEGGLLWKLAWKLSTGLEFRLKYHLDYGILMKYEHVNTWKEINSLLNYFFAKVEMDYFGISSQLSLYQFYECRNPILERCERFCKP